MGEKGVALYKMGVYLSQGLTIRGNNIYLQWPNVSKLLSNIQLAILSILPSMHIEASDNV